MSVATLPPARVPTLTEVVEWSPGLPADAPPVSIAQPIDEAALMQRILADLQRQVDLMLDHHLRVAMAPALNRLSQSLAESARNELASTLRDMVARAVSQELMRHSTVSKGDDPG